jgi:hypothetical protein
MSVLLLRARAIGANAANRLKARRREILGKIRENRAAKVQANVQAEV